MSKSFFASTAGANTITLLYVVFAVTISGIIKERFKNKTMGAVVGSLVLIILVALRIYFIKK